MARREEHGEARQPGTENPRGSKKPTQGKAGVEVAGQSKSGKDVFGPLGLGTAAPHTRHEKRQFKADRTAPSWRHAIRITDLSTRMVGSRPTMVITGDGELGLESGEGA